MKTKIKRFLIALILGKEESKNVRWFLDSQEHVIGTKIYESKYDINSTLREDLLYLNSVKKNFFTHD